MSNTNLQKDVRLPFETTERKHENEMSDLKPAGPVAKCKQSISVHLLKAPRSANSILL